MDHRLMNEEWSLLRVDPSDCLAKPIHEAIPLAAYLVETAHKCYRSSDFTTDGKLKARIKKKHHTIAHVTVPDYQVDILNSLIHTHNLYCLREDTEALKKYIRRQIGLSIYDFVEQIIIRIKPQSAQSDTEKDDNSK